MFHFHVLNNTFQLKICSHKSAFSKSLRFITAEFTKELCEWLQRGIYFNTEWLWNMEDQTHQTWIWSREPPRTEYRWVSNDLSHTSSPGWSQGLNWFQKMVWPCSEDGVGSAQCWFLLNKRQSYSAMEYWNVTHIWISWSVYYFYHLQEHWGVLVIRKLARIMQQWGWYTGESELDLTNSTQSERAFVKKISARI